MTISLSLGGLLLSLLMPTITIAQERLHADYHEHLLSPVVARVIGQRRPFLARDLIAEMDAVGIRQAVVLSMAYEFGDPNRPPRRRI